MSNEKQLANTAWIIRPPWGRVRSVGHIWRRFFADAANLNQNHDHRGLRPLMTLSKTTTIAITSNI